MLTSEFDFQLPEERIAQAPGPRGESRLMVLDSAGSHRHLRIRDLPDLLAPGDLLVINDAKVLPARLFARLTPSGGRVELLLVEKITATEWCTLANPGRRARPGSTLELAPGLTAEVLEQAAEGKHRIRFSAPIEPHLEQLGHVPLPPYIKRPDRPEDRAAYQTVYAQVEGAIAAPTAGLHFTHQILDRVRSRDVGICGLTLHVGIGTFKPVRSALVDEHRMDPERFLLPPETCEAVRRTRRAGGRIVAVGTTVVRTLEAVTRAQGGDLQPGEGSTDLFITPGFQFQLVDLMLTNFHLPRSTLLMLVCAFAGRRRILAAYQEAIAQGYRFYSYGDAMLLERAAG